MIFLRALVALGGVVTVGYGLYIIHPGLAYAWAGLMITACAVTGVEGDGSDL
jgi:hypothetical protein